MYKALILDFDGVILNSEPIHYQAYCEVLGPFSLTVSESEYFQQYAGLSDKELFPKIFSHQKPSVSSINIDDLIRQKALIYQRLIDDMPVLPIINGLQSYLDEAVRMFGKMAVCSGATRAEIRVVLEKLALQKIVPSFNVIVTAEDVQYGKPSPEGYLLTAKKLGVLPEYCLVIEDSPHGIRAAKQAGMSVIALATTFNTALLQEADAIFKDFTGLQASSVKT